VTGLLVPKHIIWKNHEVQFSINQILKDEIEKQTFNYTKRFKKIATKIIRIKIEKQNIFLKINLVKGHK
jgi:hypothetical protein